MSALSHTHMSVGSELLGPLLETALFADAGWKPAAVYEKADSKTDWVLRSVSGPAGLGAHPFRLADRLFTRVKPCASRRLRRSLTGQGLTRRAGLLNAGMCSNSTNRRNK
jgi:hypothetical protein